MGPFDFVIILVLIISLTRAGTVVMGPIAGKLGDFLGELAADRRERRQGLTETEDVDAEALQSLERRLARIEERLDFIEELRRPADRPGLPEHGSDS